MARIGIPLLAASSPGFSAGLFTRAVSRNVLDCISSPGTKEVGSNKSKLHCTLLEHRCSTKLKVIKHCPKYLYPSHFPPQESTQSTSTNLESNHPHTPLLRTPSRISPPLCRQLVRTVLSNTYIPNTPSTLAVMVDCILRPETTTSYTVTIPTQIDHC